MPMIQTDSQHYTDIADAIRDMSGSSEVFYPADMAGGVRSIPQTIGIAPIIYSLEEREVGVWTDGKPLYEKTFRLTTYMVVTNHSWIISFTDLGLSNIDHVFYTEAREIRANGTVMDLAYRDPQYSDSAILRVSPQNSNISYHTTLNGDNIQYLEFTLRYTKTTDTPGSGTWTPSGVPAHHYSTEEQVIGTWIDGKPLYESTVIGGTITATRITKLWERTDIDTITDYECYWADNSNLWYSINYYLNSSEWVRLIVDTNGLWTNTKGLAIHQGAGLTITATRLTVRYTKSTD